MITLAHISDVHLSPLPTLSFKELLSKRITGYLNWKLKRSRYMQRDTMSGLITHLKNQNPDITAITGDLVNLAAEKEIEQVSNWLKALGPSQKVCAIPGNHDAYIKGTLEQAQQSWGAYMSGETVGEKAFPYVRRIDEVAIIGCASGIPQPPFIAAGNFSPEQAERLGAQLKQLGEQGLFRVVLIHHPPVAEHANSWTKGLRGAKYFREAIKKNGAELVLHGHLHKSMISALDGPDHEIPVVGVAAASADASHGDHPARYNLFEIERLGSRWCCTLTEYGYQRIGDEIVNRLQMRLY